MQPVTTSFSHVPFVLCPAISRIVSIDSSVAGWMKLQVFTTITSASAGSSTITNASASNRPAMISLSTRFFGQPRLTRWTRFMTGSHSVGADDLSAGRDRKGEAGVRELGVELHLGERELDHAVHVVGHRDLLERVLLLLDHELELLERRLLLRGQRKHMRLRRVRELHDVEHLV